jgi:protein-S-isoprenylcysteine O-methyltransferase Ste14
MALIVVLIIAILGAVCVLGVRWLRGTSQRADWLRAGLSALVVLGVILAVVAAIASSNVSDLGAPAVFYTGVNPEQGASNVDLNWMRIGIGVALAAIIGLIALWQSSKMRSQGRCPACLSRVRAGAVKCAKCGSSTIDA